ncbi:MAG: hypothetical protein J0M12_17985, partial [Deltaproteobacteria bacterium]|nr:hypothetical protein [Deltaproteobacteria bacterium]
GVKYVILSCRIGVARGSFHRNLLVGALEIAGYLGAVQRYGRFNWLEIASSGVVLDNAIHAAKRSKQKPPYPRKVTYMFTAPPTPSPSRRYFFLLLTLFAIAFLGGFTCLRIVRDDWSSISNFQRGLDSNWTWHIGSLISNEWLGLKQARIFFLSWIIQLIVGFFGRFNYVPYYLFILALHCAAAVLLFRVLRQFLQGSACAALLACLYLVLPANTNVLFWLNNWFFSLPFFFLIAQIHLLVFPLRKPVAQCALLTAITTLGQFSGEQPLAMLYLSLGLFFLDALLLGKETQRKQELSIIGAAGVLSAAALLLYVKFVMVFSVADNKLNFSWDLVHEYLRGFFKQFFSTLNPYSWYFGFASVEPSMSTILLSAAALIALVGFFLWNTTKEDWSLNWKRCALLAGILFVFAVAALLPCIYGACSGDRPGASTRYLFVPAFALVGSVYSLLMVLIAALPIALRKYAALPLVLGVAYAAALTTYSLHNVWGFQKLVDQRIWQAIDAKLEARHSVIVTVNLSEQQGQLMAHYHSDAVSDFQADWGVGSRLWAKYRRPFAVGQSVEEIPNSENMRIRTYYSEYFERPRSDILFVTYRYGPRLRDLLEGEIQVFSSYEDFQKSGTGAQAQHP